MHACRFCIVFIGWERAEPLVSAHSRYSIHISHEGREKGGGERERGDGKDGGGRL